MAATLDLHRLFAGSNGYLGALQVTEVDLMALREAREKIRAKLRTAFANWSLYVTRSELFDGLMFKDAEAARLPRPKFHMQGSHSYRTANDCQQNPPQQIDFDDGVFLPASFINHNGDTRPSVASKAYFKIVEDALVSLCQSEGWSLNPGGRKNSCVRVEIGTRLHIDLPLYAIRDEAFSKLVEARVLKAAISGVNDSVRDEELAPDVYAALGEAEMMLAHRRDGWIISDPRKLEDWFRNAIGTYGEQVRRLSRAYKGMRDFHWDEAPVGSICLMAALVLAFDKIGPLDEARDDLAIIATAVEMAEVLEGEIENPVFPGQADKNLCKGMSPEFRNELRAKLLEVASEIQAAVYGTVNKEVAVEHARKAFGRRVPSAPGMIVMLGAAASVRHIEPQRQIKQQAPRTTSG